MNYKLKNLDCAKCANEIEDAINKLEGIKMAKVDFVSENMKVVFDNGVDIYKLMTSMKNTIKNIEPDVELVEENSTKPIVKEDFNKKELILMIVGAIFFLLGLFFRLNKILQTTFYIISYVTLGYDVIFKATKNIVKGRIFDENFLMSIATVGALCIKQYSEAIAVMLFYKIGEYIQNIAVNRSRRSITSLINIKPEIANLKVNNEYIKVSPDKVKIGDIILVKPGEKIPLDGSVIEGNSSVNTSALTGESLPRNIKVGDNVLSGFINLNGALTIKTTKTFENSTVSKILDLVENSTDKKAATETFITKFSKIYTPIVVGIALVLATVIPLVVPNATFSEWIYRSLIFLVVSCPCALVLSIPLGYFCGIGVASKNGILIKGTNFLEALNSVDTVVFDKTGTLTEGIFKVTDIKTFNNFDNNTLLKYAAYVESYSNHPIAKSIVNEYNKKIDKKDIKNYTEISGLGIKATIDGKKVLAGNAKMLNSEGIQSVNLDTENVVGSIVYIAIDNIYAGYIVISDAVKSDSKNIVENLKKLDVRNTVMLTGDSKKVAEKVANSLNIDCYYSELLPDEKVYKLEDIENNVLNGKKVIFVGDGINDAPVLARSDIGIAMGALGSDAAIEASDVVIMTDELSKIITAIKISKKTRKIIYQNIYVIMFVKIFVMILGILGIATICEAVIADVGVTIISVINATRILNTKKII